MRCQPVRWFSGVLLVAGLGATLHCASGSSAIHDCNDGVDNDADGRIDSRDPGCAQHHVSEEPDPEVLACGDGLDNDGDELVDYPADPGCAHAGDESEFNLAPPRCNDGLDNDGDGFVDHPNDPGCPLPLVNDEADPCPDGPRCPECGNGRDDDGDGAIDYPDEPGCDHAADEREREAGSCGALVDVMNLDLGPGLSAEATGRADAQGDSGLISPVCGGAGQETVFAVTVTERVRLVITTDFPDTSLDTVIYVRSQCRDAATELGCNDDAGGTRSTLDLVLEPGVYHVVVDAYDASASGSFRVRVTAYAG